MTPNCFWIKSSFCALMLLTQVPFLLIFWGSTAKNSIMKTNKCVLNIIDKEYPVSYSRNGDIIIGGVLQFFMMYGGESPDYLDVPYVNFCMGPTFQYLRHLLAFIYAIEELNDSTEILPNITMGFHIYDACSSETMAFESILNILSESKILIPNFICQKKDKIIAIIGDLLSSTTYSVAQITQLYGYPQISYGATDPIFTDRIHFSSLYHTVPNELSQFKVIIKLLTHFGWTWVGIIATDDNSNRKASEELKRELVKNGICVDFLVLLSQVHEISRKTNQIFLNLIETSSANVIILYCTAAYFIGLLESYSKPLYGKVWISSISMNVIAEHNYQKFLHAFNGSLLISVRKREIPGFSHFFSQSTWINIPDNVFLKLFWNLKFGCIDYKLNTGIPNTSCPWEALWSEHLSREETNTYRITYNIYSAVHLLGQALHEMNSAKLLFRSSSGGLAAGTRYKLNHYLKNVRLKTVSGDEIFFDEKGSILGNFDILNWVADSNYTIRKIHVGSFLSSASQQLQIKDSAISWSPYFSQVPKSMCSEMCPPGHRKSLQIGKTSCCFDCVPCSDGEISNQSDMDSCVKCPEDFWPNSIKDLCVKRNIEFLSFEDHLGASLTAVAVICFVTTAAVLLVFIKHRNTPIVKANNVILSYILLVSLMLSFLCSFLFIGRPLEVTCLLRQVTFGFIFTVTISCVLGKTVTVVVAFKATKPSTKLKVWVRSKMSIGLVIVCSVVQLGICFIWLIFFPPFVEFDTKTTPGTLILQCNEGSIYGFYLVVSYIGLLALSSFIVAFIARKLPDSFNETQYITFSMLVVCCVWVTFIPTYLSTKGKYMVAVEIFTILASTGGIFGSIFIPKCYIILLKPSLNTKEHLRVKRS